MKTYYTLCSFDAGQKRWFDDFGDYSKAAVKDEQQEWRQQGWRTRIIETDGTLADLIAKRDALPLPKH